MHESHWGRGLELCAFSFFVDCSSHSFMYYNIFKKCTCFFYHTWWREDKCSWRTLDEVWFCCFLNFFLYSWHFTLETKVMQIILGSHLLLWLFFWKERTPPEFEASTFLTQNGNVSSFLFLKRASPLSLFWALKQLLHAGMFAQQDKAHSVSHCLNESTCCEQNSKISLWCK